MIWIFFKVAFAFAFGMNVAGLLGWLERKQSAVMQDRIGANRASIFGLRILGFFHPLADALKMLTKEDFRPRKVDPLLHEIAPMLALGFALMAIAAFPFGGTISCFGGTWNLQPISSPVGLVLVLALLSLGVHGVAMAGYASGSNYALLGGLRAIAQMVSYEVCLVISVASVAYVYDICHEPEQACDRGSFRPGL